MLLVPLRRVSSGEQVDGVGLQRQSDAAEAYAKQRGWTLHHETYSDEGVSGFTGANLEGDLGRFLKDLKAGAFGDQPVALGIEDLDRLSRQFSLDFMPVLVDQLLNAGVTLSVMGKGRDISRKSIRANQMEMHELLFWMGAAHDFSAKLSARITDHRDRIRAAIRAGKPINPGQAPSWIKLVDGQWQLTPYADVVRRVIAMAQDGMGAMVIAKQLNQEGVMPPGAVIAARRKPRSKPKTQRPVTSGKRKNPQNPEDWDKNSVLQILKSPALHGAREVAAPGHNTAIAEWRAECARLTQQQQGKEPKLPPRPRRVMEEPQPNYYPALLSEAEHQALLLALTRRSTVDAPGRVDQCNWVAQRITYCTCGATMTATTSSCRRGAKVHRYRHLRCNGRRDGKTDCTAPLTRFEDAQAALLTRLSQKNLAAAFGLDQDSVIQKELAAATKAREAALKAMDAINDRHAAGERAIAGCDDPAVLTVLAKRQAGIADELKQAKQQLAVADLEIDRLQRKPETDEGLTETSDLVSKLLRTFAAGEDTPADRQAINAQLRRIGMVVTIDGHDQEMGLAIGEGEPDWQRLDAPARKLALKDGIVEAQVVDADQRWVAAAGWEPLLTDEHVEELRRAAGDGGEPGVERVIQL